MALFLPEPVSLPRRILFRIGKIVMHYPRFALDIFSSRDRLTQVRGTRVMAILLEALTQINIYYLQQNPNTPSLYQSGVRYCLPPADGSDDDWQDIPTTLLLKKGDCEDLACWRAAEMRVRQGVAAYAVARVRINERLSQKLGRVFYDCHIVVEYTRPDGSTVVEDPSIVLGMRVS